MHLHPEKCFGESTKIWLAQQNFLFKYGSIEVLFEITKNIDFIFIFQFPEQKFASLGKKWNYKIKLQIYCRIFKKKLIQVKLMKFCLNFVKLLIFLSLRSKTVFLLQLKILLKITKMYLTKHVLLF